jgi:ADP-ribose pyrophosphatase YjhB (NUDIX family)
MSARPADKFTGLDRTAKHFVDPESRFKLILSIYLFLIKDEKVLLLRRANTGYEDGKYGLPAGHADGNESARVATAREAKEEAGIDVNPEELKFAHCMHRLQEDERIDFFFAVDKWQGEPKNMEPEKCDDLSWFPLDDLPPNTIPYIKQALESYQQGIYYSEWWEGNT